MSGFAGKNPTSRRRPASRTTGLAIQRPVGRGHPCNRVCRRASLRVSRTKLVISFN